MTLFAPCHICLNHPSVLVIGVFEALPRKRDSSTSQSSFGSVFSCYGFRHKSEE